MFCLRKLARIERELVEVYRLVREIRFKVSRPSKLGLISLKEMDMSRIKFGIVLPVRPLDDAEWNEIASGVLTVTINEESFKLATTKEQQLTEDRVVTTADYIVPQDTEVHAEFQYIDDAGNAGAATSGTFLVTDDIPPVTPGLLGLVGLGEVPDIE